LGFWVVNSTVCDINNTFSCSSVFSNNFSWIFWVPFSMIAMFVYPLIAIIALLWIFWKINNPFKILFIIWIWWLIFNGYVVYNEYMIWAYCLLCLICTAIIILILILSKIWYLEYKKSHAEIISKTEEV
jgi:uncharacterized membrane protein